MMNYTPGPWHVDIDDDGDIWVRIPSHDIHIANMEGSCFQCHANADLIASAPDLLELVKLYQEALLATRAYHGNNTGENSARYKAAMDALPKNWQKKIK